MAWWWPFKSKKQEAAQQAAQDFRDSLAEALMRQDDLQAATEKLKQNRKKKAGSTQDVPRLSKVRNG